MLKNTEKYLFEWLFQNCMKPIQMVILTFCFHLFWFLIPTLPIGLSTSCKHQVNLGKRWNQERFNFLSDWLLWEKNNKNQAENGSRVPLQYIFFPLGLITGLEFLCHKCSFFELAKSSRNFTSSMSDEFLMKSKQCLPWFFARRNASVLNPWVSEHELFSVDFQIIHKHKS